jgi:hypothetical protein
LRSVAGGDAARKVTWLELFLDLIFDRGAITSLLVTDGTPPTSPELAAIDAGPTVASLPPDISSRSGGG